MYKLKMRRNKKGIPRYFIFQDILQIIPFNDGKYPAKLSVRDVVGELGNIHRAKSGDPSFQIDDAQVATLKYGAQYFGTLQAESNGATVTAADSDKVLLRWKLNDNLYRVIFGDLRIEDVSPGRLAELEEQ